MRNPFFVGVAALALLSSVTVTFARGAQTSAPEGDAAKGKATFDRIGCYQCHGTQGQGGNAGARIAAPVPRQWPAFSTFVRTTKRNMPPYTEKVLSNQDLADIYAYLRSIPAAPEPSTIPLLNGMLPR
jgi:ubiquinol-cytochrome c reductase cytochrome c subunit